MTVLLNAAAISAGDNGHDRGMEGKNVTRVGEFPGFVTENPRVYAGAAGNPARMGRPNRLGQLGLVNSSGPVSGCWLFQLLHPGQCQ